MAEQSFLRQRKIATYTYMLFGFLLAVEYSAVLISQLFYLRQTVKIENPEIYYSLITTTMAIAAAGSGIFAGQYTDKTRNLKKVLLLFAVLSMVGNVLYTIHHSVWSLFISRFLFGLTDAVQPAILGEFSRLYKDKELTCVLSRYQGFASLGYMVGLAFSAISKDVNYQLGSWCWNQNNFIGIVLAIIYIFYIIWILVALNNSSLGKNDNAEEQMIWQGKNYTKSSTSANDISQNKNSDIIDNNIHTKITNDTIVVMEDSISSPSYRQVFITNSTTTNTFIYKKILSKIFFNYDVFLLIMSTALACYISININMLTTMTVSTVFNWTLTRLSVVSTACTFVFTCIFTFGGKYLKSDKMIYRLYILFLSSFAIPLALIAVANSIVIQNEAVRICLVTVIFLLEISSGMSVITFARKLLFKVVPFESASYYEGVRNCFSRIFAIVGYLTAAWVFPHSLKILPCIISITVAFVTMLCIRKKNKNCEWYEL